jgi:hypothetical protein
MAAVITTTFFTQNINDAGMICGTVAITGGTVTVGDLWSELRAKFSNLYGVVFEPSEDAGLTPVTLKYLSTEKILITSGTDCLATFFIATGE